MNNKQILKRKLENYLLRPMFASLILVVMCTVLFFVDKKCGAIACAAVFVTILAEFIIYFVSKASIMPTLMRFALEQGQIQKELLNQLAVPYALLDTDGKILWGNKQFVDRIGGGSKKRIRKNIGMFFPQLASEIANVKEFMDINLEYDGASYHAEVKRITIDEVFDDEDAVVNTKGEALIALYLFDVTELNHYKRENKEQKLVAGLLYIDNYDEVMESTEEVRHSLVEALVDRRINMYLGSIDAIVKKMEKDKYLFVFRQKFLPQLKDTKFAILDEVKSINVGNEIPITLSIGVGAETDSFLEAYEYARVAMGLALGRGGDQAVVKHGEKILYFGGKSGGTEKTTRVRARVKGQAFTELLNNKNRVIIMGHKRPDADSFGSAVGVYRLVKSFNKDAHIVINEVTSAISPLISSFKGNSLYGDDMIYNSEQAINSIDDMTLVVVVDVNRPSMTECEDLLALAKSVVVFDHHRQTNETIENATLSYIEPYASSACEMVAEMMQYIDVKVKIRPVEADAMYAGIVIDTDNFVTKTGVRTFEAASYLRRNGADVVRVRKMFRSDMYSFKQLAEGVVNSQIYLDAFALSKVKPENSDAPTVIAAKVANELLDVEGVRASFVVTENGGTSYISARSVDDVNVQVIMEKLGGGGHANIAGAQLVGVSDDEAILKIKELLEEMNKAGDI
ncbi:MAG: DHH family phosphoesterase [Clostridium sp.]|nr:DHH family phosphoesterase [Clostridium sp.]MCM1171284.1 DHH family phosphoesterase [Clostridium sp.]MCM1207446.1 DHH family phosphoesterase [Ruminococcus sp.]